MSRRSLPTGNSGCVSFIDVTEAADPEIGYRWNEGVNAGNDEFKRAVNRIL